MDAETFKRIILPCYRRMYTVAFRMSDGDSDLAYDVVQESIAYMWEHRERLDTSSPAALCLTAVRNRCISRLRAAAPLFPLEEAGEIAVPDEGCGTHHVYVALACLPDRRRTAVTLSMRGFSPPEIAAEMQLSPENVRQLLSRGRRQLKEILSHL